MQDHPSIPCTPDEADDYAERVAICVAEGATEERAHEIALDDLLFARGGGRF